MGIFKPGEDKLNENGGENLGGYTGKNQAEEIGITLSGPTIYQKLETVMKNNNINVMQAIDYFEEVVKLIRSDCVPQSQQVLCMKARKYFRDNVFVLYSENRFEDRNGKNLVERDKLEKLYETLYVWISYVVDCDIAKIIKIKAKTGRYSSQLSIIDDNGKEYAIAGNMMVKKTIEELMLLAKVSEYLKKEKIDYEDIPADLFPLQSID